MSIYKGFFRVFLLSAVLASMPVLAPGAFSVFAQQGNSISGAVWGVNRQPVADVNVELLNEYGSTIQRARTNGAGRFFFSRLPNGRFKIRVLPYGTDYEEQEQEEEFFTSVTRSNPVTGETSTGGHTNAQKDFYLRLRKGVDPSMVGTVFVQEDIPREAKKLYEAGLEYLDKKQTKEAYEALKGALEIFPTYFLALDKLGKEYAQAGYYEPAMVLLDAAVKVNARSATSWYALANSFYNLKRYDEAAKAIEKTLELNSSMPQAFLLSGLLMRQSKRYEDAEKHLFKARDLSGDRIPRVHRELGLLYANNMTRYADAIKEFKIYLKTETGAKDAERIKDLITELEAKAKKVGA
jgi:tetratricopeptide (TPR) repeat protein